MSVFNKDNQGHITKSYPLFLGEDLGLFDTVNLQHDKLEQLYQEQVSQLWNEQEVSLEQDRMDMLKLDPDVVDLMVRTISWQHLADSVASKSIPELFLPHCTNSELEGVIMAQSFFEIIHSRTYSHIIKQTFVDPNDMLARTYKDLDVLVRSEAIIKAFDELGAVTEDTPRRQKQEAIVKGLVALFALESVAFMASFAVTFAISEAEVFQGIASLVTLIARDEVIHSRMDAAALEILRKDPEWAGVYDELKPQLKEIMDAVVEQEQVWADALFSNGKQLIGLNSSLLKEYVEYMAYPAYQELSLTPDFEVVKENPLPYMNKYIDSSHMQSAAQEIQLTSYKVGSISDDTSDLDLEDLEW